MITTSTDHTDLDQAYVPYSLVFCSETCCLRQAPPSVRAATHGRYRAGLALVAEDSIWVNLHVGTHAERHPLVIDPEPVSLEVRQQLIARLAERQPTHVVSIEAVCRCSYRMAIVRGLPLVDDENRPDWHRLASRPGSSAEAVSDLTWEGFARVMADLALGLDAMHALGVVHHDPFAFNAMCTDEGAGVWVDLNDCRPLTERLRAADIVAYLVYTLVHVAQRLRGWDRRAFEPFMGALATVPTAEYLSTLAGMLRNASDALAPEREPGPHQVEPAVAWLAALQGRPDELGEVARQLLAQGGLCYFDEYRRLRVVAANRQRQLQAEATRHRVAEREIQRAMAVGHNQEIGAIKTWVSELERGKQWLEGQREALLEEAGRLRTQLVSVEGQRTALAQELAEARTSLEQLQLRNERLETEAAQARDRTRLQVQLEQECATLGVALEQARQQAAHHAAAAVELERIQATRGWWLVRRLWAWRLRLAPPGSARSRWLGRLGRATGLVRRAASPGAASAPVAPTPEPLVRHEDARHFDVDGTRLLQRERLREHRVSGRAEADRSPGEGRG